MSKPNRINALAISSGQLFLFQSNGGAVCHYKKHRTPSTTKFRVIQVNTYYGIGTYS